MQKWEKRAEEPALVWKQGAPRAGQGQSRVPKGHLLFLGHSCHQAKDGVGEGGDGGVAGRGGGGGGEAAVRPGAGAAGWKGAAAKAGGGGGGWLTSFCLLPTASSQV